MLATFIFSTLIASASNLPSPQIPTVSELKETRQVTNIFKWAAEKQVILIAGRQWLAPEHGDDPHDEQHQDIPAYNERNAHRPPSDPYAGTTPNDRNDPFRPY
ncbi:MAG: hypothetical protein K2X27_16180 [Candidatus Obscuribacterales bacterium]|nr:hypothetical protein [Candidatus Obscuribacterales bacterium]